MNGGHYIKEKQRLWALRRGITLIGSKIDRGERRYTPTLDSNLFEPLTGEAHRQIAAGDGGELGCGDGNPGKMQAVHSSSALAVNVFHYWHRLGDAATIAGLCGLPAARAQRIEFECKFPIANAFDGRANNKHPNLDVVIHGSAGARQVMSAIECKFGEAYSGWSDPEKKGLDAKYLTGIPAALWDGLTAIKGLSKSISPADREFHHLHPAQLVKHVLGLRRRYGLDGFRLLYLWYDVPGIDGARHRQEVERFTAAAEADGVRFQSMTYQDLIIALGRRLRDAHAAYMDYLAERYL